MCIRKKDGVCYNHTFYINKIIKKKLDPKNKEYVKIFASYGVILFFTSGLLQVLIINLSKSFSNI